MHAGRGESPKAIPAADHFDPLFLKRSMISILAAIFPHNRVGRSIEIQRSLSGLRRKEVTHRLPASDAIGRQQRDSLSVRSDSVFKINGS